ncbi:hypothetical protein [Legionella sp. km772]|uniref:hypothetical protein n=1 Tax=Legionella sp. km772 TaxID=2498111 RepID=UPI000F8F2E46|nr:hypothetical protein [Legionella sp. km772]RUR12670.1 hypothetical protein ELY15_04370 [Legionella sp. km772]
MSFQLVAHDKLKQSIKESIISLIKHHHPSRTVDPDKLTAALVLLPDERRTQAEFLWKVAALTEAMDASSVPATQKRARILNAAVYYVYTKIEKSYDEGYLSSLTPSFLVSPEGSNFYKSLRTSLKIDNDNTPNDTDVKDMYTVLKEFLSLNIYKEGKAEKGYLDEALQAFASVHQYNIKHDIDDLSEQVTSLERALRKQAEKLHKESLRPVSSGGIWSWFSQPKPSAPTVVEESKEASATSKI